MHNAARTTAALHVEPAADLRAKPATRPSPDERLRPVAASSNPGPSSSTVSSYPLAARINATLIVPRLLPLIPCFTAFVRSSLRIRATGMAKSFGKISSPAATLICTSLSKAF